MSPFDIAFAIRVGALDGRHPAAGCLARARIAAALPPTGRLFTDGGEPLREIQLSASPRSVFGWMDRRRPPVIFASPVADGRSIKYSTYCRHA